MDWKQGRERKDGRIEIETLGLNSYDLSVACFDC